jgi:hypothetical protein
VIAGGRRLVGELQQWRLCAPLERDTPLAELLRFLRAHLGRRRLARDRTELRADQRQRLVGIHVADDHERAVVRRVVRPVERLQVFDAPRFDVGGPADRRVLVRMREERSRLDLFEQRAGIVVVDAQAALRIDDAALALDGLRVERQVRDPIGLEIEHEFECIRREQVVVNREVVRRRRVVRSAVRFHLAIEGSRRTRRRAVEHHVLEEVRKPGDAGHFVAAARAHIVIERDARHIAVRPDDHAQAVVERFRADLAGAGQCVGGSGLRRRAGDGEQRAERGSGGANGHSRIVAATVCGRKKNAAFSGAGAA